MRGSLGVSIWEGLQAREGEIIYLNLFISLGIFYYIFSSLPCFFSVYSVAISISI